MVIFCLWVYVMMVIFCLWTYVRMVKNTLCVLNLISTFVLINAIYSSYRFEIVQENSEKLWRYWRCAVILDYRTRVPAPLNLVFRPIMLVYKCIKSCCKDKYKPGMQLIEYLWYNISKYILSCLSTLQSNILPVST